MGRCVLVKQQSDHCWIAEYEQSSWILEADIPNCDGSWAWMNPLMSVNAWTSVTTLYHCCRRSYVGIIFTLHGKWYHVALVVDDGKIVNYVNGKVELEGDLDFGPINTGETSIGVRLNRVSWFKGAVYIVLITPRALKPDEFTRH